MVGYWNEPSLGIEFHFFKNDDILIFKDSEEYSINGYAWDSETGVLNDFSFNESFEISFETPYSGTFALNQENQQPSFGTFVVYDGSWDLDGDGKTDSKEIEDGSLPYLDIPPDLMGDQDGDGLVWAAELRSGTNPQKLDSDDDGYSDGFEVSSGSDPKSPKSIAAGGDSSFYLDADGRVWAVGDNEDGQLGDGTKITAYTPRLIMSDVKAISAGDGYTLILKKDGAVWATGENWAGQLGDGTQTDKATPVKVMSEVHAISAGDEHSLFLKTDETLWACGHNEDGQLGDGTNITRTLPVKVTTGVKTMSAGGAFSIFLKTDGTAWASGENWAGQIGDGSHESRSTPIQIMSGVKAVAAGMDHGLYLKSDGSLWSVGGNWAGQLGDGTTTYQSTPIQVFSNVMAMAAGDDYSAIVTNEGDLFLAGDRGIGIQGIEPVQIMSDVQSVSAGADHLLILKNDGSIWAQGYNESGALGSSDPPMLANPVVMMTGAEAVDAGPYHSLILKDDGSAWAVGDNFVGALGDGTFESRSNPVRVLTNVQAVATGENHSLFLKTDGSVWVSGVPLGTQLPDDYDYLYHDYREQSLVYEEPEQLMTDVKAIASGVSHCLFLKTDGSVWAAGANWAGQLGIGSKEDQASAVMVMEGVKAVAAGDHHSFFLKDDGSLWGAGRNDEGQLGDETLIDRKVPVFIMNDVKALSRPHAGDHSLFLKTDGSVWGTGRNSSGELGIGSYLSVNVPTKVMSGAIDMAVGSSHSLFLKADKTLWASGANESGQLGNGSKNGSDVPILVMTSVRSMSCGEIHSLFLKEDGTVLASGNRYYGKLGDSYEHDEFTPVESFRILVKTPPQITSSPISRNIVVGQNVTFSALVSGEDLTYQWSKNGNIISDANTSSLIITNAQVSDAGSYTVRVKNHAGAVTSEAATLTVIASPSISLSPASVDVVARQSATLSVLASGINLSYQWYKNGSIILGANAPSLSLPNAQVSDAGSYTVKVSNQAGSVTSEAATLTVITSPSISSPPSSISVIAGQGTTLSVQANGVNLSYQWNKNGNIIPGANASYLIISSAQVLDSGAYTVTVSNQAGSVISEAATLTVALPPITSDLSDARVSKGKVITPYKVTTSFGATSYTVKKLPPGLKFNTKTGVISGKPKKSGTYRVVITASKKKGKKTLQRETVVKVFIVS